MALHLIVSGALSNQPDSSMALIKSGEIEKEFLDKFISKSKKVAIKRELLFTSDIREGLITDCQILLTSK